MGNDTEILALSPMEIEERTKDVGELFNGLLRSTHERWRPRERTIQVIALGALYKAATRVLSPDQAASIEAAALTCSAAIKFKTGDEGLEEAAKPRPQDPHKN